MVVEMKNVPFDFVKNNMVKYLVKLRVTAVI